MVCKVFSFPIPQDELDQQQRHSAHQHGRSAGVPGKQYLPINLRQLMSANSWSQVELANRLNIAKQTVSNWENDNIQPSNEMLIRLCRLFNVTTDYLLGLERLTTVDVTGLADRDVAVLAELAERLKNCKD